MEKPHLDTTPSTANRQPDHFNALDHGAPLLKINSLKQYRFVSAILNQRRSSKELLTIAGVTNAADIPYKLRRRGWKIHEEDKPFQDRDGSTVRAGEYWLDESQQEAAIEALAAFSAKLQSKGGE